MFSEIDPAQNKAVNAAVMIAGFSESSTRGGYPQSPVGSVSVTAGGSNYTSAPTVSFIGGSGTGAMATAQIDHDPTSSTYGQVIAISVNNGGAGYISNPNVTLSGGGGTGAQASSALQAATNFLANCSGGAAACYPPAVNYTPLYYMINGVAFDKTKATASLFPVAPPSGVATTGSVLVRMVNAGLRMHVPSIVGSKTGSSAVSGFSLIAEDGNPLPAAPRVQSEVFMAAGKTYDVMINVPAAAGTALPVFDRELSLSGNAIARDAGMLAYIGINGAILPAAPSLGIAVARADSYSVVPGNTLHISDPSKGVIANDTNVYGVAATTPPTNGTLTLNTNGTFTYLPNVGWTGGDSFVYQANDNGPTATVTLNACTNTNGCLEAAGGINMGNITSTSNVATSLSIKPSGILSVDKDTAGYPLTVNTASVTPSGSGWTLSVDANGGFNATVPGAGTYTFTYKAQNSQGTVGASSATVTLIFPAASNLSVTVKDGTDKTTVIGDYRWVIEEDRTFYIDPNCTQNPPAAGCPSAVSGIVPTLEPISIPATCRLWPRAVLARCPANPARAS